MNIEKKSLDKARDLLSELKTLEDTYDVLGNYDVTVSAVFKTVHNNNKYISKTVSIPMPPDVSRAMKEFLDHRVYEIKKELESL